ncbi:DinB family protein [Oceanobacillus kapialis]|uniref:DinB family protein n=1 Tax=Oceanobacillus kapialis TaxID=481353 RepID=A0ABW5Q1S3_9BACI
MKQLFEYNWQVRDEWFEWCERLSASELSKQRTGGVGSILFTLFHIIDVEYSWIRAIQGKKDVEFPFNDYQTLEALKELSASLRPELVSFLKDMDEVDMEKQVKASWQQETYKTKEIISHVIVHEIHHIGQLSVWARELNTEPVSASLIGRGL